ncbi:MAG: arginine--tRNA ligase [Bacteroidales bacterium]|jgi:arginyl-tRNA synthetase|nr:arginine--tRNA ligase [Bacteroidales bacterium]
MNIELILKEAVINAVEKLYKKTPDQKSIQIQQTRKDFEGDFTLVVFPLLRVSKKPPELTANEIGDYLKANIKQICEFNVIKGFLNLSIDKSFWISYLSSVAQKDNFGFIKNKENPKTILIEYSSPNTNKPLHLGHIRNNLLGYSVAKIIASQGDDVKKVNIVNDRGIHICKSMLAWQKWGDSVTPEISGKKGDHLVGDFYVKFDQEYKKEISILIAEGQTEEEAKQKAPLIQEAQEMLRKWEAQDSETISLWKDMNKWVLDGFDVTYKKLGVDFDKIYFESDTYKLGKKLVEEGLEKGALIKKEDGSVWADLTNEGLDQKILLRSDGTSVYMTQDLGTAHQRMTDYNAIEAIYVVGNEQIYHFQVLKIILGKLGFEWSENLHHLSYGMVELPAGKMKSREGTVVDADDLLEGMTATAEEMSRDLGKLDDFSESEKNDIIKTIGLGALKYFILKVDPKKTMTFDPKESIDFNGNTGPFIQYTYARIQSLIRKANDKNVDLPTDLNTKTKISNKELQLIKQIHTYPETLKEAAENYSPAHIANYIYDLVKEFNQFYHDHPIMSEEDKNISGFRLFLSKQVGEIIKSGMGLLGINVPDRM